MALAVVNGAMMQCTCGDLPVPLKVTSQPSDLAEHQLAATIVDHKPNVNIPPFGTCKTLTANAGGTPTACVPATPAPWVPGSTSIVMIHHKPALLDTDTLACMVGGIISFTTAGQTSTIDT